MTHLLQINIEFAGILVFVGQHLQLTHPRFQAKETGEREPGNEVADDSPLLTSCHRFCNAARSK